MDTEIKKWGNSAVVRLPAVLMAQLKLEVGTPVTLNTKDGRNHHRAIEQTPRRSRRAGGGDYPRQST